MVRIEIDKKYIMSIANGQPNPDLSAMADAYRNDLLTQGIIPKNNGNSLICEIPTEIDFVLREFLFIMSLNGGVEFYNPWIKMLTVDMGEYVPLDWCNDLTWYQWLSPNYTIETRGEYSYILSSGHNGNTLSDKDLLTLYVQDYLELVDELPQDEQV